MKRKTRTALLFLGLFGLISPFADSGAGLLPDERSIGAERYTQEEYPSQQPKGDYMSTILSRDTKPLGLKENTILQDLMRQPAINWAIRAGIRHALD